MPDHMPRSRVIKCVLAFVALLAGCADVGAPPGGPEDKQGPVVLESTPVNGAVNQSGIRVIEFKLSEGVQIPKGATVFISPRQKVLPKVSWSSQSVKIELADSLAANRTYLVTLPTALADLRGNKPDSSITLAFSTGPALDSCSISGAVYADDKPVAGVTIGLYNSASLTPEPPYDSIFPDYLTASGKGGEFSFHHLPSASFRLIAFQKSARDDRFRPLRDKFGIPDRPTDLSSIRSIENLNLALTSQDTLPYKIISALLNSDRVLQLRLSKQLNLNQLSVTDSIRLSLGGTQLAAVPIAPPDSESFTTIRAYFGPLTAGVGRLRWTIEPEKSPATFDSLRISAPADTTRPAISGVWPNPRPLLSIDTAVHVYFSEPISLTKITDTAIVVNSLKDSSRLLCTKSMRSPIELVLSPEGLAAGQQYVVRVRRGDIQDLSGNSIGDSVVQYTFSIINTDSLGWLEGNITWPLSDTGFPATILLRKLNDTHTYRFTAGSSFKFALPAGKYLLGGYIDRNSNGFFDRGTIYPFTLAEPFLPLVDTVSVRARFETAGIEVQFK